MAGCVLLSLSLPASRGCQPRVSAGLQKPLLVLSKLFRVPRSAHSAQPCRLPAPGSREGRSWSGAEADSGERAGWGMNTHCPGRGVGCPSRSAELLGDQKAEGNSTSSSGDCDCDITMGSTPARSEGQRVQRAGWGDEQGLPGPAHGGAEGAPCVGSCPSHLPRGGEAGSVPVPCHVPGFPGPWSVRHSCVCQSVPFELPAASVACFGIAGAVIW